jgi:steroid 5-alpha reductase family enzyme
MAWGLGFVITAWYTYFTRTTFSAQSMLVTLLVSIWGLRLTYHITKRNWRKPEDFRYVEFRRKWGSRFVLLKAFLHVYLLQMIMLLFISASFVHTNIHATDNYDLFTVMGVIIWLIGFSFEAIADYQLAAFKRNEHNKGKILTSGLHKYTRHPNYFGEATLWWGIYVIGLSTSNGVFTIIAPITITILVRFVSGVPMLEKHYENRAAYQDYAKYTSIFIPRRPKERGENG